MGWKNAAWTRRDLDLAILRGDPEFHRLFPPGEGTTWAVPTSIK